MNMKLVDYYVSNGGRWFVVRTRNQRTAKTMGIAEFGAGQVRSCRKATLGEVQSYAKLTGNRFAGEAS